jgi:tRNA-2-methylthio-N6-dimethylallyladenosine synthase
MDNPVKTFHIATFGCQMNVRESEKLHGLMVSLGYAPINAEDMADVVIYNTCCVRENAEQKVYGRLGYLKSQKASKPDKIIAVCGCMPQRNEARAAFARSHKHIDIIFGTFNKHRLAELLEERIRTGKPVVEIWDEHRECARAEYHGRFDAARFQPHKAGVNVMYGCDNFCAYCIVPFVRGREFSRPVEDIITECETLAADGVAEIMLLGQNVNAYAYNFAELLGRVNAVEGIQRIRFMTSHPKDLSDSLIAAMAGCERVCKHIHLPVQSGSDRILASMNRGYTRAHYLAWVRRLREQVEAIAITTDIIVGFPGETEEDFSDTLGMVEEARFDGAFTFIYSPRLGTAAADFDNAVPPEEALGRFKRLTALTHPLQLAHNKRYLNRTVTVLADGAGRGRLDDNTLVHFNAAQSIKAGETAHINIDMCKTFYISGTVVV